jgi:hypothetical protein
MVVPVSFYETGDRMVGRSESRRGRKSHVSDLQVGSPTLAFPLDLGGFSVMRREKLGVTNRLVYKLKPRTFSDPDLRIAIGPKAPFD